MLRIRALEKIPYARVVVALWVLTLMPVSFTYMGMGVLFPFIQVDLDTTRAQLGLIASAIGLGTGVTVFLVGWLADVIGVRRLLTASLVGAAVGLLLFSQIQSVVQGILLASLIGMAFASTGPGYVKAVTDWVRPRTRGVALGICEATIPVGGIISAILLTFVAVTFSWRVAVILVGVMAAVLSMVFFACYRDKPSSYTPEDRGGRLGNRLPLVVKNRGIWLTAFFGVAVTGLFSVLVSYLVLFSREYLSMSAGGAAGLLVVAQVGGAVGRVGWVLVSDLLLSGRPAVSLASVGVLAGVCMAFLALIPSDASLLVVLPLMFAVGVTAFGLTGLYVLLMTELAGPGLTGTVFGFTVMIGQVGSFGIPPLFGLIVDRTDSYSMGWWMMAGVAVIGSAMLVFVRPQPRQR